MTDPTTPPASQVLDVPAATPSAAPAGTATEGASAPNPEIEFHIQSIQKVKGVDRAAAVKELQSEGIIAQAEKPKDTQIHAALKAHGETVPALAEFSGVLPYLGGDIAPGKVAEIQSTVAGWAHTAGLPVNVSSQLAQEANRYSETWAGMSEAQKELTETASTQSLQKLFGERYEPALAAARELIHAVEAKSPGLVRFLEKSGVLNSVQFTTQLMQHAERIRAGSRKQ